MFARDLCTRFGDKSLRDVIEKFNKPKQEGTVQAYQLKFKELRSLMVVHQPHLTEEYFVSSFISGLGDEVRPTVKMMQPRTVEQAADSARLQELTIEALMKKQMSQVKGVITDGWQARNRATIRDTGQGSIGFALDRS